MSTLTLLKVTVRRMKTFKIIIPMSSALCLDMNIAQHRQYIYNIPNLKILQDKLEPLLKTPHKDLAKHLRFSLYPELREEEKGSATSKDDLVSKNTLSLLLSLLFLFESTSQT